MKFGLKSPSKTDVLLECLEKEGVRKVSDRCACNIKGENSRDVTDAVKSKKQFSILQLKAFKNQHRVHDHKKLVDEIVSYYGKYKQSRERIEN